MEEKTDEQCIEDLMAALSMAEEPGDTIEIQPEDDNGRKYHVDKTLLRTASPQFADALTKALQEPSNRILLFPGTKMVVIEYFFHWLHHGKLPYSHDEEKKLSSTKSFGNHQRTAVSLWLFADAYRMPKLQNLAIRYYDWASNYAPPPLDVVEEAFEIGDAKCQIRDIIIRDVQNTFDHLSDRTRTPWKRFPESPDVTVYSTSTDWEISLLMKRLITEHDSKPFRPEDLCVDKYLVKEEAASEKQIRHLTFKSDCPPQ
ncbi:uncharacterized protein MYCFIDRAFT_210385 [Pseudocercospora fijiensis CIRAD86]|uniref:BTB domain-containing protein n=1 Tax=Pseudocercospora fijiensis (strain CIRAD86) TaxID=383855 RepID=M3B9L1_PSEFD|nr:uncharacterized protein MYCFIDRAFT_210385 [Pseudocercospora fijiensis CIRAD86]EME86017.1 hypothetical protein MYCFIDRAFT_210385 [Pseudocercospora fijiensis CIRAD86]